MYICILYYYVSIKKYVQTKAMASNSYLRSYFFD